MWTLTKNLIGFFIFLSIAGGLLIAVLTFIGLA